MSLDDWKKTPEGKIALAPIASVNFARLGTMGAVRFEFSSNMEDLRDRKTAALQLAMTPQQAREIGEALVKMSKDLEASAPTSQ